SAKTRGGEKGGDSVALAFADFSYQMRACGENVPRVDCDGTIGGKTINTAVDRAARIELAHVGFERCDVAGANVWRVRDYEIAAGRYAGAKVTGNECRARADA